MFLLGVSVLLFLVIAQNDSVFLSRHRVARLGAHLDCATVLFFRERDSRSVSVSRLKLPVVVLALVRLGLITYKFMARTRPYAIVLIFILATIITPTPDILTLIAMGLPMCLLYEKLYLDCVVSWNAAALNRLPADRALAAAASAIRSGTELSRLLIKHGFGVTTGRLM